MPKKILDTQQKKADIDESSLVSLLARMSEAYAR